MAIRPPGSLLETWRIGAENPHDRCETDWFVCLPTRPSPLELFPHVNDPPRYWKGLLLRMKRLEEGVRQEAVPGVQMPLIFLAVHRDSVMDLLQRSHAISE